METVRSAGPCAREYWASVNDQRSRQMNEFVRSHEKGAALIIALIMLLILTLIGITALESSRQEVNIVGNQRVYNAAFYAAESGLEFFRTSAPINNPNNNIPFNDSTPVGNSANGYRYKSDRIGFKTVSGVPYSVFKVTAEGRAPSFPNAATVNIEAVVEIYAGGRPGGGVGGAVDEFGKYN
jgi:Tfp pilus assembly protein PilX